MEVMATQGRNDAMGTSGGAMAATERATGMMQSSGAVNKSAAPLMQTGASNLNIEMELPRVWVISDNNSWPMSEHKVINHHHKY